MCDKSLDAFVPTLKFFLDWFVTNKMFQKLNVILSNDDMLFVNVDSDNVTFFSHNMGLVNVGIINVSFDDVNFDNNVPESVIIVRLMA